MPPLYVVINADDMGASPSVNDAVCRAHEKGALTSASIMAGGAAFGQAAKIAHATPGLSTGIHITLCDGRAVLPQSKIPGLVDDNGFFEASPAKAGYNYWRHWKTLSGQIQAEMEAQFDRLEAEGLKPSHADSHHHLHMHPLVFRSLSRICARREVKWIRITREPIRAAAESGAKMAEWGVFRALGGINSRYSGRMYIRSASCSIDLSRARAVKTTDNVAKSGSCQPVLRFIKIAGGTVAEFYCHPDMATERGRMEMEAVGSGLLRRRIEEAGVKLAGFAELASSGKGGK
ncbi:MAG: ChbG/HpnK family deacetylase [Actinomycetota bacterium]|nr:ChbG/HpnK family deacetylase [Actinomycetota bacterium]